MRISCLKHCGGTPLLSAGRLTIIRQSFCFYVILKKGTTIVYTSTSWTISCVFSLPFPNRYKLTHCRNPNHFILLVNNRYCAKISPRGTIYVFTFLFTITISRPSSPLFHCSLSWYALYEQALHIYEMCVVYTFIPYMRIKFEISLLNIFRICICIKQLLISFLLETYLHSISIYIYRENRDWTKIKHIFILFKTD